MAKPALFSLCPPAACYRFGGREVIVPCSPLLGPFPTLDPSTSLQVCPGTHPPWPVCLAVFPACCIPWQKPSTETKQVHHVCSSGILVSQQDPGLDCCRISDLQDQPWPQESPVTAVPIISSTGP